jgi:hypothetical protein
MTAVDDRQALETLDARLRTLLPEEYRDSYEDVQPVSMGSAGLKFGADGQVAWDEIWGSFCDLAMAGGPPHKGTLLEPGTQAEVDAHFSRYDEVADEICRGIRMVTGLRSYVSETPGWVAVTCLGDGMTGWLVRAIVMENVAARGRGAILELPAAPHFRLEKEIKNVVTVVAKTCHYWTGHMWRAQKRDIAELFVKMAEASPLVEPALAGAGDGADSYEEIAARMAGSIHRDTGLTRSRHRYAGWLGLDCTSVGTAIWLMRALVASNILSRREDATLLVPVNPATDPAGDIVARAVHRIHRLAAGR